MDKVLVNWCIILALYRKKTWAMKVGNLKIMPISECQVFKRGIHGIMAAMLTKKYVGFFPSHRASILEDRNSLADVGPGGWWGGWRIGFCDESSPSIFGKAQDIRFVQRRTEGHLEEIPLFFWPSLRIFFAVRFERNHGKSEKYLYNY